jgi:hypothetical protein
VVVGKVVELTSIVELELLYPKSDSLLAVDVDLEDELDINWL